MSRRSKLTTLIRLASLAEREKLTELAFRRKTAAEHEASIQHVDQRRAAAEDFTARERGVTTAAALRANRTHIDALDQQRADLSLEHQEARRQEEEAREAVAQAKLKVKALNSAKDRREQRERRRLRRKDDRRLDEANRDVRTREQQEAADDVA